MKKIVLLYEEEEVLESNPPIALPFTITYDIRQDVTEAAVYPMFKEEAETLLEKYSGKDLFENEVRASLSERVGGELSRLGFTLGEESEDIFITRAILCPKIAPAVRAVRLENVGKLENLTGYDIDTMSALGYICYCVVMDGKILSAATTNTPVEKGDKVIEIGVETAEGYGGRGYGYGAAAALFEALTKRGISVHYEYALGNRSSAGLISKFKTEPVAMRYYIVAVGN